MALLQCMKPNAKTFEDLALNVIKAILQPLPKGDHHVDFVTDQYPAVSIKDLERQK